MFERVFKLSEHKTTVKTEVMAGITTFMTMAYILAVNPSVLGSTGMDTTAVLLATALASCLGTLCMAFMANLPFALSAGMGLNAFMAYTVVAGYGYSWQTTLTTFAPSCSNRWTAASSVPPVAIRSSTTTIFIPGLMSSRCTSMVSMPYSSS